MMSIKTLLVCSGLILSASLHAQISLPYSTSFEGAVGNLNTNFPAGWTWEDLNTIPLSNQGWQIIKNSPNAQNARTDSTAAHMFGHSSQTNDDWLYTPSISCIAGATYTISFWYSRAASFPSTEKLALHVGTAAIHTSMGSSIWENTNISSGTYQQATVTWTAPTDGDHFFGFHYFSADFQFILLLDDISITGAPNAVAEVEQIAMVVFLRDDILNVQLPANSINADLTIVDLAGRNLVVEKLTKEHSIIPVDVLPTGTYIARIRTADGRTATERFITHR